MKYRQPTTAATIAKSLNNADLKIEDGFEKKEATKGKLIFRR